MVISSSSEMPFNKESPGIIILLMVWNASFEVVVLDVWNELVRECRYRDAWSRTSNDGVRVYYRLKGGCKMSTLNDL